MSDLVYAWYLLARSASNQEIAETLVVAIDTAKHQASNTFSKQAAKRWI